MSRWLDSLKATFSRGRNGIAIGRNWLAAVSVTGAGGVITHSRLESFDVPLFGNDGTWCEVELVRTRIHELKTLLPAGLPTYVTLPGAAFRHAVMPVEHRPGSPREAEQLARWNLEQIYGELDGLIIKTAWVGGRGAGILVGVAGAQDMLTSVAKVMDESFVLMGLESSLTGAVLNAKPVAGTLTVMLELRPDSWGYGVWNQDAELVSLRAKWREAEGDDLPMIMEELERVVMSIGKGGRERPEFMVNAADAEYTALTDLGSESLTATRAPGLKHAPLLVAQAWAATR